MHTEGKKTFFIKTLYQRKKGDKVEFVYDDSKKQQNDNNDEFSKITTTTMNTTIFPLPPSPIVVSNKNNMEIEDDTIGPSRNVKRLPSTQVNFL